MVSYAEYVNQGPVNLTSINNRLQDLLGICGERRTPLEYAPRV